MIANRLRAAITLPLYWVALTGLVIAAPGQVMMWLAWWLILWVNGETAARRELRLQLAMDLPVSRRTDDLAQEGKG